MRKRKSWYRYVKNCWTHYTSRLSSSHLEEDVMRNEPVTAIRVIARILAGIMILIYGFALVSILEGGPSHNPLPFVLEGAPFGTYEQNTQLGLLTGGAGWGLSLVGAILLFWWERTAAGILIAASIVQTFLWGVYLLNHAMPTNSLRGQLVAFVLPPFVTAILLLIRLRNPLHAQELADGKAGTSSLAPK